MTDERRVPGALVVMAWAFLNGLLALGLLASGGYAMEFLLFVAGVGIALVLAIALFGAWLRAHRRPPRYRVPGHAIAAGLGGAGAFFAGLGFVYGFWFVVPAVPLLVAAGVEAIRGLRDEAAPRAKATDRPA